MKNKLYSIIALFLLVSRSAIGQFMSDSEQKTIDTLQKLKPLFKAAKDDSSFVTKYGDEEFKYFYFVRGDQEEDIEEQIYKTPVGDVAGPFKGHGTSNYLLKVESIENYALRSRAQLIYIKFNDFDKKDTAQITKLANKYSTALAKGKKVKEMAEKDDARLVIKDLKWYYETDKDKEYFDLVFNAQKNSTFLVKTEHGTSIIYVTNAQEKAPYRIKLVPLVKKK